MFVRPYLLFPFNSGDLQNHIFDGPFGFLRTELKKRDVDLQTHDCGQLKSAEKVLCFNHRPSVYRQCRQAGLQAKQLVLFLMEPEVVVPAQYSSRIWNLYGTVFTFLENLVDGKHVLHMRYPQGQPLIENVPSWENRQFLMLMNANKYSYVAHELYTLRREAITFFEQTPDFHLYGHGWLRNGALNTNTLIQALQCGKPLRYVADLAHGFRHSLSYRGSVPDKYAVLQKYKFCLALENEAETQGWISEKLFDCLCTGTVPVYFGAKNITNEVPQTCFIDYREYSSFKKLEHYLRDMTEQTWLNYQRAGQEFIRSDNFRKWLPQNTFTAIAAQL